jgi:hypothetical protein
MLVRQLETRFFKSALVASVAAVLALTGAATMAQAATFLSGSFNVSVYQGAGGGDSGNPQNQANQTNPLITGADLLGSGVYTGDLNFNMPFGGNNQVGTFLLSGGGAIPAPLGTSTALMSTVNFGSTSVFVITGNLGAGTASGTITHDDGATIWDGAGYANFVAGATNPNTSTFQTYNSLTGAFEIIYVEANGLPADLVVTNTSGDLSSVPLPAALPLFAAGLGVMGLFARRRKRNAAAIAAA